jgi:trehalose synthase
MKAALADSVRFDTAPYLEHVPSWVGHQLHCLAKPYAGATVVHVNSTAAGGGVAEILHRLVPLQRGLGLDAHWLVMNGDAEFFTTTKMLHNALQGQKAAVSDEAWNHYFEVNHENFRVSGELLERADFVVIHDPQPAALLALAPRRKGKWAWRCHIDLSRPARPVWRHLYRFIEGYDASVFSLASFSRRLRHPQILIPPAIDPLTEKNKHLSKTAVDQICEDLKIPLSDPIIVQISRFDRFKDPLGVINAFRILRRHREARLVLAGGGASDDPEGQQVLEEVFYAAAEDDSIHILELPADAHVKINALQRAATVVIQKSIREGFGLVVTEALWKGKPVIGGAVGGITLQVLEGITGYLVHTVEGCAYRMRECLRHPIQSQEMGKNGIELVRDRYLITRQLRDHLMLLALLCGDASGPQIPLL